ncbi:MAG: metallophosphoesterase family protein [Muribaculaceae bacterium]
MDMKLNYFTLILCAFLSSCDMIEYHPYDTDIKGDKNINERNIKLIEDKMANKTEFTFAVLSDTQRWYDETNDAVDAINKIDDVDFVIHCGDISDFGAKLEFEKQRDILNRLKVPYVCLLGNHDCLATGQAVFSRIFGEENFSFTVGNVRFICLNTNALEYDYSHMVPDFGFIEDEITFYPEDCKKTVIAMHSPPYSDQFNNNVAKLFDYSIHQFKNLLFCLNGHLHTFKAVDFFSNGTIYYQCPCADKRQFLLFTINKENYEYEVVEY